MPASSERRRREGLLADRPMVRGEPAPEITAMGSACPVSCDKVRGKGARCERTAERAGGARGR